MSTMQPFLVLQGRQAEKAIKLHIALSDDREILDATRWQEGEQVTEGSIGQTRVRAAGQSVLASIAR